MQTGIPYSHAKTSAARYSNYLIVLLGILTAFGPLVTDMYLPTLPSMTVYFGTSQSMVQMGLTTSMAGLALGQLLFGPLSDKFGRRPLLLVSLLLFVASTVICIFSPTVYVFVGMRLFQGIGAAGGIVISRSVAQDQSVQVFYPRVTGNSDCFGHVQCDSIIMGDAKIKSIPAIVANHVDAQLVHEAAIGRIVGDQILKLMTLGLTEEEAEEKILDGFLQ